MIRINKFTFSPPSILYREGVSKVNEYNSAIAKDPGSYQLRTRQRAKFDFDSSIYGHDDAKSLLKEIQSHKCCFCEAKITHVSHGDIEHFRPKAGYVPSDRSAIIYPGYFWLAYDWDNLFLACEKCNGRPNKGNFFPLVDESHRASYTRRDIIREEPLFIDPAIDDPEDHISFIGPDPIVKNGSAKGKASIKHLGLAREELVEHRRSKFNLLKALEEIVKLTEGSSISSGAKSVFNENYRVNSALDSEYSSMVRSNFSEL